MLSSRVPVHSVPLRSTASAPPSPLSLACSVLPAIVAAMQHQQHLQDPMLAYPPQVYYSSSHAVAGPSHHHASPYPAFPPISVNYPSSAAFLPAAQAFAELHQSNCCDICCPGCSSCIPFLGNCQCCDRNCLPCCQTCWGCMPGGTCSATGSCPTLCSGYVFGWSVSVVGQWLSFLLLLIAVPLNSWIIKLGNWARMGLWTITLYNDVITLDNSVLETMMVNIPMFNALRAFTILSLISTLLSAILATVRLYRQQRRRLISNRSEWTTYAMTSSSLVCVALAMALGTAVIVKIYFQTYGYASCYYGGGLILLNIVFGLMVIAAPLHVITTVLYNRANSRSSEGLSDVEGVPAVLMEQQQHHYHHYQHHEQQQQEAYQIEGQAAPLNGWPNSSSSSSGSGTFTPATNCPSDLSNPSPYQPPDQHVPRPSQHYQVYMSALPAPITDKTPQW